MLFKSFIKTGSNIDKKIQSNSNIFKLMVGITMALGLIACGNLYDDNAPQDYIKSAAQQKEDFQLKINYAQSITPGEMLQIVAHINANIHKASSEKELKELVNDKKIILLTYEEITSIKANHGTEKVNEIKDIKEENVNILLAWKLATVFNLYGQKDELIKDDKKTKRISL